MPQIKLNRQELHLLLDGESVEKDGVTLQGSNPRWHPMQKMTPTPAHILKHHRDAGLPDVEVWANHTYEAFVSHVEGQPVHLSIKRYDRRPCNNWRHFQQIKNEVVGPDWEAVQIFPGEDRLVDDANQYHLWCLPDRIPFGYATRSVTSDEEVQRWNDGDHRGRQEPWQPGLTIGGDRSEGSTSHAIHDAGHAPDDRDARQRREGYLGERASEPDRG